MTLHEKLLHGISTSPRLWHFLRWILEAGFRGEKEVLRREGLLSAKRVIDAGCGTGEMARNFDSKSYFGVDMDFGRLVSARRKAPNHTFATMDLRSLAVGQATFEAALVGGVLHHLDDATVDSVLAGLRRALRPDGRLIAWEDVPARDRGNFVGSLIQNLDRGDFIRKASEYEAKLREYFTVERTYPMRSGVCDYEVFVCRLSEPS